MEKEPCCARREAAPWAQWGWYPALVTPEVGSLIPTCSPSLPGAGSEEKRTRGLEKTCPQQSKERGEGTGRGRRLCSAKALKSALSGAICSRRSPGADGLAQAPGGRCRNSVIHAVRGRRKVGHRLCGRANSRDGAGKLYISYAVEKLSQPFFWSRETASSLLGQGPDSNWFFSYFRAQVTFLFTGSQCSFEKAKFSKKPVKASESLCTCLLGVIAKCTINRSFWRLSDLLPPWITPNCPEQGRVSLHSSHRGN